MNLRDISQPPTLIPTALLAGPLILGLLGGRKTWPWLVAGLLMVGLSFGLRPKTPELVSAWLGAPIGSLAQLALLLNEWVYSLPIAGETTVSPPMVGPSGNRTLHRGWYGPTTKFFFAGSAGVRSRFYWESGWPSLQCIPVSRPHASTSRSPHELAPVEFTDAIKQADTTGPVLLLPAFRSVEAGATREELPVFANLEQKFGLGR